ncbi:MAG TPA: uroporphyrinogen-III synthase [Gaiellaceae bacterium]|nr:uroporphyrinogen-III synthase [Gaiellaceae bacterium]
MRVIVTRPEGQADELAGRLRALGHDVVVCPLVRVEALGDGPVDVSPYDWVVVTSANGARELARRLHGRPQRLAAVGPATAAALVEHGLVVDLVPQVSTQEGLLAELPRPAGRVLLAAAEGARRLLVDELDADFVPLYRTVQLRTEEPPAGDLVVLASGSAARAFGALGLDIPAVSIGPQTTAAAQAAGVRVVAQAATHDAEGLLNAIATLAA